MGKYKKRNWKNKKKYLSEIKNVLLPNIISLEIFEKDKNHLEGFNNELFFVLQKKKEKELEKEKLILRPTSESFFYDWYRQTLQSYKQLPIFHNQWCSVFRAEKNTNPFLRSTEFLWQEGHGFHFSEKYLIDFCEVLLQHYRNFFEKTLNIAVFSGKKIKKKNSLEH